MHLKVTRVNTRKYLLKCLDLFTTWDLSFRCWGSFANFVCTKTLRQHSWNFLRLPKICKKLIRCMQRAEIVEEAAGKGLSLFVFYPEINLRRSSRAISIESTQTLRTPTLSIVLKSRRSLAPSATHSTAISVPSETSPLVANFSLFIYVLSPIRSLFFFLFLCFSCKSKWLTFQLWKVFGANLTAEHCLLH